MLGQLDVELQAKIQEVAGRLGIAPEWLTAVIAFETGHTFSPSVRNAAGSGATGLIQFMPKTAQSLGTTTAALANMTAVQQMEYVYRYLAPFRGRMGNVEDVYMAVLFPSAVGKGSDYVLFSSPSIAYTQNRGLDLNGDGKITKWEAAAKVLALVGDAPSVDPSTGPAVTQSYEGFWDLVTPLTPNGTLDSTVTGLLPGIDSETLLVLGAAVALALLLS